MKGSFTKFNLEDICDSSFDHFKYNSKVSLLTKIVIWGQRMNSSVRFSINLLVLHKTLLSIEKFIWFLSLFLIIIFDLRETV
jgi:hypothetical protein